MNKIQLSLVIVALLLIGTFVDESHGWLWRRRRRSGRNHRVCNTLCSFKCYQNPCRNYCCSSCTPYCTGKRNQAVEIIIPLPCKFSDWDRDGDGKVNKIEFVSVTHARGRSKDVKYVFHSSDKNGDKVLSKKELFNAPLVFEKC
ncbi:uncharacterized protein LOC125669803 [Ostrea edulis]|uniref:uncharacterized protein LOC125669803 n=1 Tax=Ostrea edulis TaxID=37623 RepID=UPI00209507EF|nr:uncharacterized protein LOC125669803 [Ostrea edulis]